MCAATFSHHAQFVALCTTCLTFPGTNGNPFRGNQEIITIKQIVFLKDHHPHHGLYILLYANLHIDPSFFPNMCHILNLWYFGWAACTAMTNFWRHFTFSRNCRDCFKTYKNVISEKKKKVAQFSKVVHIHPLISPFNRQCPNHLFSSLTFQSCTTSIRTTHPSGSYPATKQSFLT